MPKDFWRSSRVTVLGAGSWGTVLANLAAVNCRELRLWARDEGQVRAINATRAHARYWPEMQLRPNIQAVHELERAFEGAPQVVIWALPSSACREMARRLAPLFRGDEILIHATKGVESGTLKRVSEMLREELPCPRIGVISGPNLAAEIARGEPAATVVASRYQEAVDAGTEIFASERFRVYQGSDVTGVEWAGTLKNVLAIAAGALDALKFGWNTRAMMLTRGLAEMVRFGVAMGGEAETFLGLAGMGDLLATCGSPTSRNYRVGFKLASGEPLEKILAELGSTAEGVRTTRSVWEYAKPRGIEMPITETVYELVTGSVSVQEALRGLMLRPAVPDGI